jgi:hypothetical protein
MEEWGMWRKVDRLAGGKLKDHKQRGEWAELYFMMQAAGLGMKVSRPFGSVGQYDVGVDHPEGVVRVQVKSSIYWRRQEEYSVNVVGPQRKMYAPGLVDFFAVLLIPIDEWYIIPYEVLAEKSGALYMCPNGRKHVYRQYREAWHLLRQTGLTIQACVDPAYENSGPWLEGASAEEACESGVVDGEVALMRAEQMGSGIEICVVRDEEVWDDGEKLDVAPRGLAGFWRRLMGR